MRRGLFLGALAGCRAVLGVPDVSEIQGDASVADGSALDANSDVGEPGGDASREGGVDGASCVGDLKTDRANCGRCGHDCLGGDCTDGVCQPVTLVQNEPQLGAIAVDGDTAYWVANYAIHKCAVAGCGGVPTAVGTVTASATRIVVRGPHLAWATGGVLQAGDVFTCPIAGCGGAPTKLGSGSGSGNPNSLAADTTNVYWSNTASTNGEIVKCAWGGAPTTFASARPYPAGLVDDGTNLYWIEETSNNYRIAGCPTDTCAGGPKVMVSDSGISNLASNGTNLVWQGNNGISTCTLPACAMATSLSASVPATSGAMTLGSAYVYWVDGSGIVQECALAGCGGNPTPLASGQSAVYGITSDALAVYWTSFSSGRVMKVAKP
jgi:hypothetical protein